MTNINLSQSIQPKKVAGVKNRAIDRGTLISLAVLILTGLAVGGVKMYLQDTDNKVMSIEDSIISEKQKINGDDVNRIADFQNRRDKVEMNIDTKTKINGVLDKINGALMTDSYVTNFNYNNEAKVVTLDVVSDNIEDVAKQTLNFKKSPSFASVDAMGDYLENDDKKIVYDAELVLSAKKMEEEE